MTCPVSTVRLRRQDLGLDLAEAVCCGDRTEIRGARRPDPTKRRSRQVADDGLEIMAEDGSHTVTGAWTARDTWACSSARVSVRRDPSSRQAISAKRPSRQTITAGVSFKKLIVSMDHDSCCLWF